MNHLPVCGIRLVARRTPRNFDACLRRRDALARPADKLVAVAGRGWQLEILIRYGVNHLFLTAAAVQIQGDGVLRQTPLRLVMEVAGCAIVNNERRGREHTAAIEGPAGKFVARTERVRQGEGILHGVFYRRHVWTAVRVQCDGVFNHLPVCSIRLVSRRTLRNFDACLRRRDALARPADKLVAVAGRGWQGKLIIYHGVKQCCFAAAAVQIHGDVVFCQFPVRGVCPVAYRTLRQNNR